MQLHAHVHAHKVFHTWHMHTCAWMSSLECMPICAYALKCTRTHAHVRDHTCIHPHSHPHSHPRMCMNVFTCTLTLSHHIFRNAQEQHASSQESMIAAICRRAAMLSYKTSGNILTHIDCQVNVQMRQVMTFLRQPDSKSAIIQASNPAATLPTHALTAHLRHCMHGMRTQPLLALHRHAYMEADSLPESCWLH